MFRCTAFFCRTHPASLTWKCRLSCFPCFRKTWSAPFACCALVWRLPLDMIPSAMHPLLGVSSLLVPFRRVEWIGFDPHVEINQSVNHLSPPLHAPPSLPLRSYNPQLTSFALSTSPWIGWPTVAELLRLTRPSGREPREDERQTVRLTSA